ncbi:MULTISPECIES: DM13 domain-containing protein [Exiguobacterium]|uniref:DM13 domain-containing protein n=1 Tax=Exiguobacterium TaxID=33986 RepID=UPI001BE580D0|nr:MULTISPECIES: DM13 domain-containing protein [Exiguobacterium]MCT4775660.1 DM13 domain-containing protein [Exiguobacterium aquaticum]MCT4787718.1 DM13 domain-containing protein [Exiguobacterium mexicanum]
MKAFTKLVLGLLLVFIMVIGWWLISPLFLDQTVDEGLPPVSTDTVDMTEDPEAVAPEAEDETMDTETLGLSGMFMDGEKNYKTSGTIKTINADDGVYLRFEDFQTTNGPDLFVYLIQPGTETTEGISLGALKGNTGNQNYLVPEDVDLTQYSTIVIWCRAFDADFGFGELTQ